MIWVIEPLYHVDKICILLSSLIWLRMPTNVGTPIENGCRLRELCRGTALPPVYGSDHAWRDEWRNAARVAMRLLPCLKVLLTRAYSGSPLEQTDAAGDEFDVISKPYIPTDLAKKVQQI